ncbi:rho GTPase-activating protein 30 isoform X2 [Kryptolebias marmoratus]|uniref:rho GTPase-activating protein 30 isoform X2 n=1 Tax=Kryptolebias marmoratus TaxID=37003 RepID=UPI0007F8B671|nr:rho GTPase-activating protein 30 isoform X2 [Kryptolebias marmoratus]
MKRVRRKGGNKEKVFGCDLLEHLTTSSQEIPLVLRCCSEFVEHHGIVDGIYRLSGVSSNIQKLRSEFESDGAPDLNKEVYLQDIHCVSSLCKAYFRELPNPLLTYQLYDKFAEAVAIQLEEERLVKIRDVLKELPSPHYRTLEFLMRHLLRMASYSSETSMHSRNLAIVWAPNLLRSKDIEASGFNGTAAFMEVRVQSIVVEFILTHVPQLFPEEGVTSGRRKSLPSPSAMPNKELIFFKTSQPNFGNISPGDGPLPIRPYHTIIEGTDKRKGSLKGRKWMSIFNIKERFPDKRWKHKQSTKEKDRTSLRPARSMDSLSTPPYPNEGSRRSDQRTPPTNLSPLVTTSTQPGSEAVVSPGGIGGSEYAVTYRRGTGLVSGGAGTQGTYTALDPEGLGIPGSDGVLSRSPGHSSKAGRRAAMHITGPTLVTVPLHITSKLALGVLQGGGSDRIVHRGRERDGGDKVEGKDGADKKEMKEHGGMEWNVEEPKKMEEKKKSPKEKEKDKEETKEEVGDKKGEGAEEEEDEELRKPKQETLMGDQDVPEQQEAESFNSNTEEDKDEDAAAGDQEVDEDYMVMKAGESTDHQPAAATHQRGVGVDLLNSAEVEDDHKLSGYIQDNFEFLDQMDCSGMEHMDCSLSYQVNEFSVEPPGHSDDEYEIMNQSQSSQTFALLSPNEPVQSPTESSPHRPLSLDLNSRHTKSLSLPYMTSPVEGPDESCSEDEPSEDDSDENDYCSEDDESMFVKSLPPDFFLNTLSRLEADRYVPHCTGPDEDPLQELQSPERKLSKSSELDFSACKETEAADQEEAGVEGGGDEDGLDEKQVTKQVEEKEDDKVHHQRDQMENDAQSATITDGQSVKSMTSEAPTSCCVEFLQPSNEDKDESNTETKAEDVKEAAEIPSSDSPCSPCASQKETLLIEESGDTLSPAQHPGGCFRENETETDDACEESALEEPKERSGGGAADENHEQDVRTCRTNSDIWSELEDVVCEVIEDEENEQREAAAAAAAQADVVPDEKEQTTDVTGENTESDKAETNKTDVREEEEESQETNAGKLTEKEKQNPEKNTFNQELEQNNREVDPEKEEDDTQRDESRTQPQVDKQPQVITADVKELKENNKGENNSLEGVGRKLVVSKQPKVYQVKAVPVVPPKPQHCKITALTLRQQQQQRERRDNLLRAPAEQEQRAGEPARDGDGDGEAVDRKERPALLRERRRDGVECATRDPRRNSPLSMCFDEAVAKATLRREKERVREGEAEGEGLGK